MVEDLAAALIGDHDLARDPAPFLEQGNDVFLTLGTGLDRHLGAVNTDCGHRRAHLHAVLAILAALPIWYLGEALGLAAVGVAFVLVLALLLPPINRARDGREAGDENAAARFRRLHRLSVMINLGQMVVVVVVFFRLVA